MVMVFPDGNVKVASSRITSGSNGFGAAGTFVMQNSSRCHGFAEVSWMNCGPDWPGKTESKKQASKRRDQALGFTFEA